MKLMGFYGRKWKYLPVVVTQEHNLVVLIEVVVGNSDGGGCEDDVDESVRTVSERAVIDPNVMRS